MRAIYAILAAVLCVMAMGGVAPHAMAQTPPDDPTLWVITNRGNVFELEPPDLVPTTDIVSSPYIEFQRIGGLVISDGEVREAGQYTDVGPGNTYVISNWAEGRTYGIPNGAPLAGEMQLHPIPHLGLRTPDVFPPNGIRNVEVISGNIVYSNRTHMTHGEHAEFLGSGRAIVWLETSANPNLRFYAINMVCPGCTDHTHAVLGGIPDDGGNPKSTALGTAVKVSPTPSVPCAVDGVHHPGCGTIYAETTDSAWPMDPRSTVPIDEKKRIPDPFQIEPVLNIVSYDTALCPDANSTNTRMEPLNDTMFRMVVTDGCIMENYRYEWWDGVVNVTGSLPLRAGLNVWENSPPNHPAIILNLDGGDVIQLQVAVTDHQTELAFHDTLNVHPGELIGPDAIVILHDAYAHLGAYTRADINDMAARIQTLPQLPANASTIPVAHNPGGGNKVGGILGHSCISGEPFQYCITIFDRRDLPQINNAGGVVYDHRAGVVLHQDGVATPDVDNHANVFVSPMPTPPRPYLVEYDSFKLNLIQGYAVIPVSGHISVEELYLAVDRGLGCKNYVDTTTDPHHWSAPTTGWLRLKYLETDYGGANSVINVPLLPWYDTICMRTHGQETFRQFSMDNFFIQGSAASFGGMHHITKYDYPIPPHSPMLPSLTGQHTILSTEVVLPGSGTAVLDMDVDLAARVMSVSTEAGGGEKSDNTRDGSCDWADQTASGVDWSSPPRADSTAQRVRIAIDVEVFTPTIDGSYAYVDGLSVTGDGRLEAERLPETVGDDCMEVSHVEFDFAPEYRTIPITTHNANMPIKIEVKFNALFQGSNQPEYADGVAAETIYVETNIERLSFRVH